MPHCCGAQDQARRDPEQPDLVGGVPAYGRGVVTKMVCEVPSNTRQ